MSILAAVVLVAFAAVVMSMPIEVVCAVVLVVWGIKKIASYNKDEDEKPKKKKRLKIVEED